MNPITVTWAPNIYTPWGLKIFYHGLNQAMQIIYFMQTV